jgi:uncharacterized membrane protein
MPWWTREISRQLLALPLTAVCFLIPGATIVKLIAAWDIYAIVYLLLTWLAFRKRKPAQLYAMARAVRRRRLADRILTSPPDQISQGAAAFALAVTIFAMPKADEYGLSTIFVLTVCAIAVATSWLALQVGFTLVYLGLYARSGGLEFPGGAAPRLIDFVYFSVAIGTTFGTTDVTVTRRVFRRQILIHSTLAFLFNTLILAAAVTILTSYVANG